MVSFFIWSVLLIPWVILPVNGIVDQLRIPKAVFYDLVCFGMITFMFKEGIKATYQNKWLAILVGWIFFTIFMNWYVPILFNYTKDTVTFNFGTIEATLHFILSLFLFLCLVCNFGRDDFSRIAKAICLSAVLVTVYGVLQVSGFDPLGSIVIYKERQLNRFSAILDHPNLIGNYLAISLPFFLFFKKPIYGLGACFVIYGLFLSQSTLSIVAAVLGVLMYFFINYRQNRRFMIAALSFLVLFGILVAAMPTFNKIASGMTGRKMIWEKTLVEVKRNPAFGQGLGVYKQFGLHFGTSEKIEITSWLYAHNDWLERWCEIGLLGLFLMFMVIGNSLRNFNYSLDNKLGFSYLSAFMAFLIIMCGSFPMEYPPLALMGIITFSGIEKL